MNSNLRLIIGTITNDEDAAIQQVAKAMADEIDKYIMDIITKQL